MTWGSIAMNNNSLVALHGASSQHEHLDRMGIEPTQIWRQNHAKPQNDRDLNNIHLVGREKI